MTDLLPGPIDVKALPATSELKLYTTEALTALRVNLEEAMMRVKTQIGNARSEVHASGQYSDAAWYASAMAALRLMGQRFQEVLRILGERRRAAGEARERQFERAFIHAAKRRLSPEVFAELVAEAKEEA